MPNTIIGYIIAKAETQDRLNLSYETDIITRFEKDFNEKADRILNIIASTHVDNRIEYQNLVKKIDKIMLSMNTSLYKIINSRLEDYYKIGFENMGRLIIYGNELERKYAENISEFKSPVIIDEEAIKYLQDHAFQYVKDLNTTTLSQLKISLSSMLASGNWDRKKLEDDFYDILDKNRNRAHNIAQTELSLAYNNGTLNRLNDYNIQNNRKFKKYWHGFKYSEITCKYCRPRIGKVYDVSDNTESLPAHVRCRCLWLPYEEGWDKPISNIVYRNAESIKRVYSSEDIYRRINETLNINYADYLKLDNAIDYLAGDRSENIEKKLQSARTRKISDIANNFTASKENSQHVLSTEFNNQMSFWKNYTAKLYVDNDIKGMNDAKQAIKGIMILPWSAEQLSKWNLLLDEISDLF